MAHPLRRRESWDPLREVWDLQREMNRLFEGWLTPRGSRGVGDDSILEIALPKKEEAKPKQIKVQAEDGSEGLRQEGSRASAESSASRGSERDRRMTQ